MGDDMNNTIRFKFKTIGTAFFIATNVSIAVAEDTVVTNVFVAGEPALASEVNQNFSDLAAAIDAKALIAGPAGPQGEQGPKGETGAIGPVGLPGTTGPKGDKGDAGAVGAVGPKGDKGDAGAVGTVGPKGDKGDAGAVGAAGPKGDKGDAGAVGAVGPKGDKGDVGAVGATGPKGDKGDTGAVGAAGPKGDKGDAGAVGAAGPKGDAGAEGVAGPKGDKGDAGVAGPIGPKGDKGDTGLAGADGTVLPDGLQTGDILVWDSTLDPPAYKSTFNPVPTNGVSNDQLLYWDATNETYIAKNKPSYTALPANIMQPYTTVSYIVALQGVFPSRSSADPLLGEIIMFGGNFAPRGWAFADGQLLPISQNTALFSLFGTIYGGDGRTTFALPDLRGRAAIHAGSGPGLTPRPLGSSGGAQTTTVIIQ